MPAEASSAPASDGAQGGRGRPRQRRRGQRGGRGGQGQGRGGAAEQGGQSATTAPVERTNDSPTPANDPGDAVASSSSRGRGRARGRGRGGGGGGLRAGRGGAAVRGGGFVAGTQRTFGGHLTSEMADGGGQVNGDAGLSAAAAEFVPGQAIAPKSRQPPRQKAPQYPLAPKSTAEDLPTRIHQDISNGQYECVICASEVLRSSKVWSCNLCWTVVHLPCVKKWHKSQIEKPNPQEQEQPDQPRTWRCPGCNSKLTEHPSSYHCWCGKDINPQNVGSLPPHSCGQTCTKPRATCPHLCFSDCHAGPCRPCDLMGPTQPCFCGKQESTKRCSDTDYDNGWSCKEICGDLLPCGEHFCEQECHSGLCGSCTVPMISRCYCGKVEKEIPCDRRDEVRTSFNYGQIDAAETDAVKSQEPFDGCFDCGASCGRKYDCGHHECQKTCHPQDEVEAHCPLSPDVVENCPCGKTPLEQLLEQPRQSCQDPVPHCQETCGKILACGHECDRTCHVGPCPPCYQRMDISCRCGRTSSRTLCHGDDMALPVCMRVCQAQLNCGRHQCGDRCCPGEKKAVERQAAKRKNKLQSPDEIEAEHICIRVCGRTLKCGAHQCQQICHRGPCGSCLEAVFDEISCTCGRTVLQPPQPCGTRPPECRFDCTRRPVCGHPPVSHNCHPDDIACPKCPFLVEKPCVCGKQRLKNQPCWFEEVRCGLPCNEKLKCGTHTCKKQCHRPGQCEDADITGSHCNQPCGKSRKSCGHADQDNCHAPYPCKEDKACQAKEFITCACQHRKKEIKCLATRINPEPERETLKCDDECLRLQRNQKLAAALSIDPATHTDDHVPYSDTTLKLFRESVRWCQTQEREFRVFASDADEKRIRFKPMPPSQRAFLHALAEDFGLDTESQDPEPHRHVSVFKTPRFVSAPSKTLAQCVKIKNVQAAAAKAGASASEAPKQAPFNALLLSTPRFALTIEELDAALAGDFAAHNNLSFTTSFLPSDEVLVRATPVSSWGSSTANVETSLANLKPAIARTVAKAGLAGAVTLVHADQDQNVLRREVTGETKDAGGWSSVVGRRPQAAAPAPVEKKPASGFVSFSRLPRKKIVQETEEDWEAAAEKMDD
ncbi:transcriptional repressor NF-X1 [Verticillium dahliae]|nr:transcriptional repressor NF-X1 [Verticillium dahliae]